MADADEAALPAGSAIGLVGASASGKSTLCDGLVRLARVRRLECDSYYRTKEACPQFDLHSLPWPSGQPPAAFAARGSADTNAPGSVDWDALHADLQRAMHEAGEAGEVVLVDGLLLLADHTGAAAVRALCSKFICLVADDASTQEVLMARKFTRRRVVRAILEKSAALAPTRAASLLSHAAAPPSCA